MFDPRPLCCSSLTTAVGGTTDTNFVDSAHPTVARISPMSRHGSQAAGSCLVATKFFHVATVLCFSVVMML